ncbi:MAG: single-stranded DNA-binding protein [Proteobacteria bacterium]|nr:single-stranded DNA-binding protein [Pseudomonadota bacterium]
MASLNKVTIIGRLGKDPELRYTQNQTPVCSLSVATTEYRGQGTEKQEHTEWHRITVFGRQAENISKYLSKGSLAYYEGRLRTSSWEDQAGQKKYSTDIIANNVQFLGAKQYNGTSQPSQYSSAPDNGGGFPMPKTAPPTDGPYGNINTTNETATTRHRADAEAEKLPVIYDDPASEGVNEQDSLPF